MRAAEPLLIPPSLLDCRFAFNGPRLNAGGLKQIDDLLLAQLFCYVKRGQATLVPRFDVGAMFQQQPGRGGSGWIRANANSMGTC